MDLENLILLKVESKIKELRKVEFVQYEGGRLHYETTHILYEINLYNTQLKLLYLESLKKSIVDNQVVIRDNQPGSQPEITNKFLDWIDRKIIDINVQLLNNSQLETIRQPNEYFPFTNFKFYGQPVNFHYTGLIFINLDSVLEYFRQVKKVNFIKNFDSPHLTMNSYKEFKEIVFKFSQETGENIHKQEYLSKFVKPKIVSIQGLLNQIFEFIEPEKEKYFSIRMKSRLFDSQIYNKNWYELIYDELLTIKRYIDRYYEHYEGFKIDEKQNKGFQCKLDERKLKFLYKEFTQIHTFIKDIKTNEIDFINVFTKEFKENESKIFFDEETTQIAYILSLLKPYFINFYNLIEKSQKFISKNNVPIKANNISSQLSKTTKKGIEVKNQKIIENIFERMNNQ